MNDINSKIISASLLRLRMKSPFFSTWALFAKFIPSPEILTAATDGKDIYFNPDFLQALSSSQQTGLLLHEVFHAALLHVLRRGVREPKLWNIAADIVVNGAIAQQGGFELPFGGIRDPALEHLSVEEVYEILQKEFEQRFCLADCDLLEASPGAGEDSLSNARKVALEAHWRNALQQASVIARTTNQGNLPAGMERELRLLASPQLDLRSHLLIIHLGRF